MVTAFPRWEGDVITPWLVETLKLLKSKGIDAEVLTSSYQGLRNQVIQGIPIERFRYFLKPWENLTHEEHAPDRMKKGILYKILPFFYILAGCRAVYRAVKRESIDIVHIHWPFPHALFGYFAKRAGAKVVLTFYGVELRWVKTKMPLFRSFLRWGIGFSDRVTAISTYTAREVRELIPEREVPIKVIPYTISIASAPKHGPSFRKKRPMALYAGRLVERKGVEYLLRAFAEVVKEIPAELILLGEGPEKERLMVLSSELGLGGKAVFKGWISQEALAGLYSECNVFVLPAIIDSKGDTEGLGVVLLEAMSYKKPVIASGLGGILDIVVHEETGLLVKEKKVSDLASALRRILKDPQLAERLGLGGYRRLKEHFSRETIGEAWQSLYASLI